MRKSILLAGAAIIVTGLVQTSEVSAETLEDVLVSAYTTNPTLLARRAQLRATDESVPQALSNWRPTVSLSSELTRGRYESNTSSQAREQGRTSESATLTITQPIYRGGRTVAETRQAEANVLANRADLEVSEQTVLLAAASAYLDVVRDEAVLNLNVNNEQVLRRQLEAAQERFRVGEITRTDVSQAEARLAGAVADRAAAEGTLQNSRAKFITVVGRPAEALQAPKQEVAVPVSFDEIKSVTLAKNPSIVYSDWIAEAAKHGIDLKFGELLPTVSLVGEAGKGHNTSQQGNETESLEATLKLTVPIYEAGDVYSQVRETKHTYGRRKIEADKARRDALESATKAWEDLTATRSKIKSLEAQLRASELALAGVEEEAKVGSRTVLDVLNAEQELFTARVNLVRAQRDETVAAYTLKSALGEMTADGLGLKTEVYDPTKNYNEVRGRWIGTGVEQKYED
ncbi:MAG: TolC family outer membrane protein [Magnetospirillum gryphiswaldense]|nr:TolC family outer membrane protein [Magnetospirillum gryphiswaldense]